MRPNTISRSLAHSMHQKSAGNVGPPYNGRCTTEALMTARLALLALSLLLVIPASAKEKKKPTLPEDILRAQTVRVMIDPDAGEPLDQPQANAIARDNVEKALLEWGRFRLVMDGEVSDLVIAIRTGNGRSLRPTMKGGPIDQHPGVGQSTDSNVRIGVQQGHPPMSDPNTYPQDRGPHIGNEVGPSDDMFTVYRAGASDPLDSPPVWRYIKKDCLRPSPQVPAVEEFRKLVAEAEKPKVPKTP